MSAATCRRLFARSSLALPFAALVLSACAGQGDISRVQPDAIDKTLFYKEDGVTPRLFYYRKTTTGVPPTSAYSFEGLMGDMYKVRFEIREDMLIGYRSYNYADGAQSPFNSGANNTDTPFLVYAIESHFDIKREYNAATGEETNVISENTKDRPWNARQYMRVDWSRNRAEALPPDMSDPLFWYLFAERLDTGYAIGEGDQALVNPDRPIVRRDYIDWTSKEQRTPDILACYSLFGADDEVGPWGCGPAELTYRNSLMPVPDSEYEPLAYPDRQLIRTDDGKPIRYAFGSQGAIPCTSEALAAEGLTGEDCTEAALDQFSKFGYFRTALPTWDRQVGSVQEGRQYYINRWNIWQETIAKGADGKPLLDEQGNPRRIALSNRTPRTITYYLNPEFPEDPELREVARETVQHWNDALKETVAGLILTESGQVPTLPQLKERAKTVPDVFVLAENGCSMANVNQFVTDNPDVRALVEARDTGHVLDFDALDKADLLKACTALEVVTENRVDGRPKFVWQRNGDLRYSFLYWIDRPQVQGPLGYGPSSPDPETGEIVSAAAYIYGGALDIYAKFAADSVRLANGTLSVDDLLSGKTISDVLAETTAASRARAAQSLTPEAKSLIQARVKALGKTRDERLVKVGAGIDDQPLHKIRGTAAEKLLFNDDVLPAIIRGYRPGDVVPGDVFDQAMKLPFMSSKAREARRDRFQKFAQHGCVYMAEFADDAILGTALELDKMKLSPDALFKRLRALIFRGLADHEIGHTVGLRHNFSASTDALNYLDQFWQIRSTVTDSTRWEADHKLSEYAYASVMDYGARFNSDVHGLGKYDTAAIRFGYGQLFDVIDRSEASAWTGPIGDMTLRDSVALRDYTRLPTVTGGIDKFDSAATAVRRYKEFIDVWTADFRTLGTTAWQGVQVFRERPYKFCDDLFEGNLDCKTWDRGANQREVVSNVTEQFRNYYAFNAYRRGRTNWAIDGYLNRLQERYFNRYSEAFQFFFFLSDLMNYPYDLGPDLMLASIDSLNSIAAILQTPEPGLHCPTELSPNVATFPVNTNGYLDESVCLADKPKLELGLPDAKPFYIDFSDDYYYTFTRVGSLLEKLQALFALTSTESRFFRVDELSDVAARSSINYYRLFRDEMVKLLSGVIRNDHANYAAWLTPTAPYRYEPTPVVDVTTFGYANPPVPPYAQPGAIRVETPVNRSIRTWALLLAMGRLGSTWDNTLDFQNFLAVSVKGSDDDFTLPANQVVEFTHPETGVTYRSPTNAAGATPNVGKQILDELNALTGVAGTPGTIPKSLGSYTNGDPVPNWHTAKAAVEAAKADMDQMRYLDAVGIYNYVNQLMGYRIDLISDIRMFRKQLTLP